jgi:protein CpxP
MKKLFVLALLIVGTTIVAQERNRKQHGNEMEQFTPEQQSQLMLKKMTLELDLNDSQQKEMSTIISDKMARKEAHKAEMKAKKEKGIRPSSDELFAMKSKMLDEQIATKKRMEKILTPKQFEKWNELKRGPQGKGHEKRPKHCMGGDPIK